jgi:hypothetical protein
MMKRILVVFTLLLLMTAALGLKAPASQAAPVAAGQNILQASTTEVCTGTNLLFNPSFEGTYTGYEMPPPGHPDCGGSDHSDCGRAQMAPGWHPWWRAEPRTEVWMNIMPEYKPSLPHETPPRVRSGEKSQHYFSFWSTHEGGLYQQVTAVANGRYCFSAWGHAWSSRRTLPGYLSDPNDHGELYQKVGIDPTGGTNWQSSHVIWSDARMQYDQFGLFTVEAVAQANTITVFLHSRPNIPVKHNDVYWDDATLSRADYLQVEPASGVSILLDMDEPKTVKRAVTIDLTPGLTWTASLDPAGTLKPTLSAMSGQAGQSLEVSISSQGLAPGAYHTTLTISTAEGVSGSPATLPITLWVAADVQDIYLPAALQP